MNRYNVIMVRPPPPAVQHLQMFTVLLNHETCVTATCLRVTSGRLISSSISSVARCKPTCKASSTHDNTCGNSGPESWFSQEKIATHTHKDPKTPLLPCALWFLQPCNRRIFFPSIYIPIPLSIVGEILAIIKVHLCKALHCTLIQCLQLQVCSLRASKI